MGGAVARKASIVLSRQERPCCRLLVIRRPPTQSIYAHMNEVAHDEIEWRTQHVHLGESLKLGNRSLHLCLSFIQHRTAMAQPFHKVVRVDQCSFEQRTFFSEA